MVTKRAYAAALVAAACALLLPGSAAASKHMLLGIFDDASMLAPEQNAFDTLKELHVQVVRLTLAWGGPGGVANKRPRHGADPADPAYDWRRYDDAIEQASDAGIEVLLTIVGTPAWANHGAGANRAPTSASTLRAFAYAAAERYSGTFLDVATGRVLPRVGLWLAWNEPNNPVFLRPQFTRAGARWRMSAPAAYARICNAVYAGVHAAGGPERVACGATAPRGGNNPNGARPSISPLAFLRSARKHGLRTFDAWAHHPYYGNPREGPRSKGVGSAVELGNIDAVVSTVTRLYGRKPIWITEYGYQTNPPDRLFGVSWKRQAAYVRLAYAIARANPRIDLFTWFLLRDSPDLAGWQSGLLTADGRKKPAFDAFARLRALAL
ncbi:MAG TPA: hypothetical protein VFB42_06175 [Gaiellaceae bacterium]|nr:hypothetical protein [Gaiellaceae bacterium]